MRNRQKPRDLRMEAAEHPRPKESESMHHITGGGDRKPSHFRTSTTTDAAQAAITVLQDQLRDVDQPETVKLAEAKHAVAVLHEQLAHLVATSKKLESGVNPSTKSDSHSLSGTHAGRARAGLQALAWLRGDGEYQRVREDDRGPAMHPPLRLIRYS